MGQESSTLSSFEGLQISRVQHASPAFEAGLIPYFDFIVGVDTVELDADNYSFFYEYVRKSENKAIKLRVFNIRIRMEREVSLTPRDWSGDRKNGLMGFNVSWESAEKAVESTWHITNVMPGSPAARADLMATRDYLLGMQLPADFATMTVFKDSSEFHTRLEEWRMVQEAIAVQKPGTKGNLLILVFDSIANEVKEIIVETSSPNESLGVEVANGYLHVVPPTPGSTSLPRLTRCVVTKSQQQQQQQAQVQNQQPPQAPDFSEDQVQKAQPHLAHNNSNNNNANQQPAHAAPERPALPTMNSSNNVSSSSSAPAPSTNNNSNNGTLPPPPSNFPAPPSNTNNTFGKLPPPPPPSSSGFPPFPGQQQQQNQNQNQNQQHHVGGLPPFVAPSLPPPPRF